MHKCASNACSSNALNTAMAGGPGNPLQELVSGEAGQGADGNGAPSTPSGGQGSRSNSKKGDRRIWLAKEEGEQMQRELHSLNVAIGVNVIICLAKVWVHLISGSSAMLAEALHSVADILNQVLLRVGVLKAKRAPTPQHPYGYMRDRFVWSLISAVGIFFLGAGASVIHGLHTLMEVRVLDGEMWSYAVLGLSAVLEGYSLLVAARYVMAGAAAHRMSMLQQVDTAVWMAVRAAAAAAAAAAAVMVVGAATAVAAVKMVKGASAVSACAALAGVLTNIPGKTAGHPGTLLMQRAGSVATTLMRLGVHSCHSAGGAWSGCTQEFLAEVEMLFPSFLSQT
ncbi:hypothetical protein DUNSADRAFT_2485 [Dunaliella salina]|uniref:Cation efflux protein transmembrane domain-containing protein n=1 Tax=Dunaliella salina TaxID=3046 RepID=A0ABQ7FW89_DUNSA|nr:hypothetical protein DUNSADRAFT_2485 [Dunaliella salina]|eukprot:KAF5826638.1 hypothetical protein DUNSADRAFT_2485 [Dunaliella salina]